MVLAPPRLPPTEGSGSTSGVQTLGHRVPTSRTSTRCVLSGAYSTRWPIRSSSLSVSPSVFVTVLPAFCACPSWQVTYGPGSRYKATNCTVVDHDLITCLTVPGIGSDLPWAVTVAGQRSINSVTTSYAPPAISSNVNQSTWLTSGGFEVRALGDVCVCVCEGGGVAARCRCCVNVCVWVGGWVSTSGVLRGVLRLL
jgi:hypothetical protein